MRTVFGRWVAVLLFTAICAAAPAIEPPGIREPEQIVFEGVENVALKDVCMALRTDFDAILASHPEASLAGYLRAIEVTTLLGYLHSGFLSAKVTAQYDEEQPRIVVRVEEGPRHVCGDIQIDGAQHVDADTMIKAISEPAKKDNRPWIKGRPAPFDETTKREIHKRVNEAFAAQGFFSPWFDIRIAAVPEAAAATLEISIKDEGPRAEIGEITVSGNQRESEAEILHYLDLRAGQLYDSDLADRVKAKLAESGRFLSAKIDRATTARTIDGDREIVPILIALREYEQASPLAEEFTAEEKSLLTLRDWIHRWSRGETEHDLVLEVSASSAAVKQICDEMDMPMPPVEHAGVRTINLRIVIAPNRGQTVTLWMRDVDGSPVYGQVAVLYPNRLLVGAPLRSTKLTLPSPRGNQTTLTAETKPAKETDKKGHLFQCMFGVTFKTTDHPNGTPLHVKATLDTAATLSFLYQDDLTCEQADGVWTMRRGGKNAVACRIDAETGRPIALEGQFTPDDEKTPTGRISLRTEMQAWEREAAQIEAQLASANVHDAASPFRAMLEYGLDETAFVLQLYQHAPARIAAVESLRKLASRWSPPALTDLWPTEFGELDKRDEPSDTQRFSLPRELHSWTTADFLKINSPSRRFLAAFSLPVYRRLVPREGWPWPVGRDVILGISSNATLPTASLINRIYSSELGPVGSLVLASLNNRHVTAIAATAGRERLTAEDLRKDYEPFLSGDGWISKWVLSLAEAARSLDEAELRSIAHLLPDNALLQSGGASLLATLKDEPEKPVSEGLARMLNVLWNLGGRQLVSQQLEKLAPQSPSSPSVQWSKLSAEQIDQQLKSLGRRSSEPKAFTSAEPKLPGINSSAGADKLNDLEKLAEELQKPKTEDSEKPAAKEPISITEQIDRLQKQQKK